MRLATIRTGNGHAAVRVDRDTAVEIGPADVETLLADPQWYRRAEAAAGPVHELSTLNLAPVVRRPAKIFCVGLNYRSHITEMGRPLPEYPTLFAKFANSLIGARDDLIVPSVTDQWDWEVELAVVIGRPVRRASAAEARKAIAGYTVLNDVTARDWQWRTREWLSGKTFEASTPVGPWLVTADELGDAAGLEVRCEVDGVERQRAGTADLLFPPAELVAYISRITTLEPGDLIATGTPGGVGAARDPQVFLRPGNVLRTTIEGIGECVNLCVEEGPDA